jgi:hypothetical protein
MWMLVLAAFMAAAVLPSVALAAGGGNGNGGGRGEGLGWLTGEKQETLRTGEKQEAIRDQWEKRREEVRNRVAELMQNRLEIQELRKATLATLTQQRQRILECKRLLCEQLLAMHDMTPEERAQYREEIRETYQQIISAHLYCLQIRLATREEAWDIRHNVTVEEAAPSQEEVDAVVGALEGA